MAQKICNYCNVQHDKPQQAQRKIIAEIALKKKQEPSLGSCVAVRDTELRRNWEYTCRKLTGHTIKIKNQGAREMVQRAITYALNVAGSDSISSTAWSRKHLSGISNSPCEGPEHCKVWAKTKIQTNHPKRLSTVLWKQDPCQSSIAYGLPRRHIFKMWPRSWETLLSKKKY